MREAARGNTLALDRLVISPALAEKVKGRDDLRVVESPGDWTFDAKGILSIFARRTSARPAPVVVSENDFGCLRDRSPVSSTSFDDWEVA